jgi:hypothetical protein
MVTLPVAGFPVKDPLALSAVGLLETMVVLLIAMDPTDAPPEPPERVPVFGDSR